MATAWYAGVCDTLLARIQTWEANYEKGEVYATRKFMTDTFNQVDLPVQFRHVVPFSISELTHLVRILKAERPEWTATEDFAKLLGILKNPAEIRKYSNMIQRSNSGLYSIALAFEKPEIAAISELLLAVKQGRPVDTMENLAATRQGAGKGMWEQ